MKSLTKMRLINWHYFENETIEFKGSALITGDNGSGKSTLLDAMQFVLTGGGVNFNTAAHEEGKRNLMGYVRCKTGKDEKTYERQGSITSHIALEFFDDETQSSFVLGAVIDSYDILSRPESVYYFVDNQKIQEGLFTEEHKLIRNISAFKTHLNSYEKKQLVKSKNDAASMFQNKIGGIDGRFPTLLSKSLAFKAMKDVRSFVYMYLLDEKKVDIMHLKENIKSFISLEKLLNTTKKQLEYLSEITESAEEIYGYEKVVTQQEYIIEMAKLESEKEQEKNNQREIEELENQNNRIMEKKSFLNASITEIEDQISQIDRYLATNETKILMDDLERSLRNLQENHGKESQRKNLFLSTLEKEKERTKKIFETDPEEIYKDFYKKSVEAGYLNNEETFIRIVHQMIEKYEKLRDRLTEQRSELTVRKNELEGKIKELDEIIRKLKNNKLTYGENTEELVNLLRTELARETGKKIEVRVLCELIDITDEKWRNAIEGYLNTQKFNIIVDPQYYDASLRIYEKYKISKGIYGAGLVNTGALKKYNHTDEDVLASLITSRNSYARQYVNLLLGQVVMANLVDDLKDHKIAITSTCMLYKNFTARQLNPGTYEIPYIGEKAVKVQLEKREEERSVYKGKLSDMEVQIQLKTDVVEEIKKSGLEHLLNNLSSFELLDTIDKNIYETQKKLEQIDRSTIMSKQMEQDSLKRDKKTFQIEIQSIDKKINQMSEKRGSLRTASSQCKKSMEYFIQRLKDLKSRNESALIGIEERFLKEARNRKYSELIGNFENSKKGYESRIENRLKILINQQSKYNSSYEFGAPTGTGSIGQYHYEMERLRNSTILDYEEQIRKSKENAEYEFKEHFILKLRENILNAKTEYRKLNQALKGIQFGKDEYSFSIEKSREFEKFYEMIMDDNNMGQDTIFSMLFNDKHKEAIDELFRRISSDQGDYHGELEKFTDYRTYMDYDIKIKQADSTYSFSKICREKSGGETQTPYYVTIGASFKQLYSSARQHSTIGLMLLDEAFEKMDEERIKSMMEFLNHLELQVILAVPSQSADHIIPYVQTTVLVENDGHTGFTDSIHKMKVENRSSLS